MTYEEYMQFDEAGKMEIALSHAAAIIVSSDGVVDGKQISFEERSRVKTPKLRDALFKLRIPKKRRSSLSKTGEIKMRKWKA